MFGKKKKEKKEENKEEVKEENLENKDKKEETKEPKEKSEKEKQEEIKEKLSKGYLKCHFIFEVVGKPADYIEQIMEMLLKELEKEPNVLIISKSFNKSTNYQDTQELFTTFAETELLIENFKRLIQIIFDYMPTSIEILEPDEIKMKIQDYNLLVNELANNLHSRDIAAKKILFEKDVLFRKLQEIKGKTSSTVSEEKK